MVDPTIEEYVEAYSSPQTPLLAKVAAETLSSNPDSYMMSGSTQGQLLATLVHLGRPRNILEIGTYTGYSALAMAEAMPADARITTLEIDVANARAAGRRFAASPYGDRIDLRVGPALPVVKDLAGPFDLVFIDADKTGYINYFQAVLPKLAPTGLIAVDNTLHNGLAAENEGAREMVQALHEFNIAVRLDPRVDQVILTVRDGLTLIRPAKA